MAQIYSKSERFAVTSPNISPVILRGRFYCDTLTVSRHTSATRDLGFLQIAKSQGCRDTGNINAEQ